MIVRDFLICLLQMYLLEDLEKNMLPYRRENFLGKFLVYFVIALVMLGINHLESSIFNMVMIPVTYMIVSMVVFRGNIWKKLVIVCCYYVLAIIPEFLFATLTNAYGVTGASEGFGTEIEKTLALLLMSTMTFLFIKCINQVTRKRDYLTIENKTFTVLLMLPTATIIILGCVFYSNISFEGMNRVMVPVGASLLLLTNIFIFSVFDRFVEKSEEVKKMARLYQKSRAEIANLQYMNKVNEDNRAFLHDINKFICTVAGLMEEGENQEVKEIMQNIEDCCVVYNQSIGKGVLIAFIKNKISSISYTKEEYRKQLAFFLPPAMIPSEFVNVERFPLSTNGKIDRKGLAESIQKNIKVKHNAKATLISQKKEYVELAKSIKKIVCSISGNDYIDYEDNLLENGLDSLLLSQISGRIVSDIQEAQGMRFDEILRASLTMPTIMGIAQYISDCKNPSKNQMHSNAGNQTRNSYTVVYIFGDNENEIRDVLIEKLSASNISCKRVGGQEIIERCHEDISVKKKYIIAFSEMASLCITKASELLGENIIINRIFLINPSKAKESDLYLGDISIIDGNSVAIKSWEKAVLGNVREFESNSNGIFDIIMRELENDK